MSDAINEIAARAQAEGKLFTLCYSPMSLDIGRKDWACQIGRRRGRGETPIEACQAALAMAEMR